MWNGCTRLTVSVRKSTSIGEYMNKGWIYAVGNAPTTIINMMAVVCNTILYGIDARTADIILR